MKTIPNRTRRGARRLLTVQTAAGLALLALAVPYSGCLTSHIWNPDTVLIAAHREGRVEFKGDLAERFVNASGDTAYPGTMSFTGEKRGDYDETGWLVVPAAFAGDWSERIRGSVHAITDERQTDEFAMTVVARVIPEYQLINLGYRPEGFAPAKEFPFRARGEGFDPEKSGYKRETGRVLGVGDLRMPASPDRAAAGLEGHIAGFERNGPVIGGDFGNPGPGTFRIAGMPDAAKPELNTKFNIVFNPLKRTGTTDFFNTTSKVALTVPAVAGDVATTAVFAGGAVVAGGVIIVAAPFVAAGGAIGKAFKDKPGRKSEEKPHDEK